MLGLLARIRSRCLLVRAKVPKVQELSKGSRVRSQSSGNFNPEIERTKASQAIEYLERTATKLGRKYCGHPETVRIVVKGNLKVRCTKCGWESEGIDA